MTKDHKRCQGKFGIRGQRITIVVLSLFVLIATTNGSLLAQSSGSSAAQLVTLEVKPFSKIFVSGNPSPLIIRTATSFTGEHSVTDENTTYSLITNVDNMKIVASIDDKMPEGTKLLVRVANDRALSAGQVDISDALSPVDVVTGINKGRDRNQSIGYTFTARADIFEIPSQARTITLTLTN